MDDLNYAREVYLGTTSDFVASLGDSSECILRNDVNYSLEDMFSLKIRLQCPSDTGNQDRKCGYEIEVSH